MRQPDEVTFKQVCVMDLPLLAMEKTHSSEKQSKEMF